MERFMERRDVRALQAVVVQLTKIARLERERGDQATRKDQYRTHYKNARLVFVQGLHRPEAIQATGSPEVMYELIERGLLESTDVGGIRPTWKAMGMLAALGSSEEVG